MFGYLRIFSYFCPKCIMSCGMKKSLSLLLVFVMRFIKFLLYPILRNKLFFVFLYILGVLTTVLEAYGLDYKLQRYNFFSCVLDVYILCITLEIAPNKSKKIFVSLFAFFSYVLSVVDIFCVETFRAKIGPEIVNVVLETNSQESSEFIDKYINWNILYSSVGIILSLFVINILVFFYENKIRSSIIYLQQFISLRIKKFAYLSLGSVLVFSILYCIDSRIKLVQLLSTSDIKMVDMYVSNYSENTPFNNLLFSLKLRQLSNKGLIVLSEVQESVKVDSCTYTSSEIVLIFGESYIKTHSQLYGYEKVTTPRQLSRINSTCDGCLVPFYDVISPSNLTSVVFKNVLSLHSVEDENDWSSFPLFPVLFRLAGYNVTFITNQFVKELNTDIFNISGGLFINNERISRAQFDYRNTKAHQFDIDLISDYDSLKVYNRKHQLTIFHLAGQHIDFYKRCPSEMKKFKASDYKNRLDLSFSEKQIVADYDNATYYNDFVVDSIIKRFNNKDVIIVYMPDHGEECFDELHRMGRLPVGNFSPEVLRQEYSIPFWIWCSQKYIDSHPAIWSQIQNASDRPFMTDDLSHLLLYLAGIHCQYYKDDRCLISNHFNNKRRRLIEGRVDYDQIVKNNK